MAAAHMVNVERCAHPMTPPGRCAKKSQPVFIQTQGNQQQHQPPPLLNPPVCLLPAAWHQCSAENSTVKFLVFMRHLIFYTLFSFQTFLFCHKTIRLPLAVLHVTLYINICINTWKKALAGFYQKVRTKPAAQDCDLNVVEDFEYLHDPGGYVVWGISAW